MRLQGLGDVGVVDLARDAAVVAPSGRHAELFSGDGAGRDVGVLLPGAGLDEAGLVGARHVALAAHLDDDDVVGVRRDRKRRHVFQLETTPQLPLPLFARGVLLEQVQRAPRERREPRHERDTTTLVSSQRADSVVGEEETAVAVVAQHVTKAFARSVVAHVVGEVRPVDGGGAAALPEALVAPRQVLGHLHGFFRVGRAAPGPGDRRSVRRELAFAGLLQSEVDFGLFDEEFGAAELRFGGVA
mmetsp:Transcript_24190/g.74606  ORF Transcript_24190/g.74606 Transcript_24190/m.74606 type:complete len:244 (+) Transcript_24190:1421-2152(+)